MAATNYATNYAGQALEAFALESLTAMFDAKYDWTGAKTVTVFENNVVALGDYTSSTGYGTPTLVQNAKDDLTVTQDKGFSGVLDRLDMSSTAGTLAAGAWLGKQIRQVITPTVDKYRFDELFESCPTGQISASAAVTSANAYTIFQTGNAALDENLVPQVGRVCFAIPDYLNKLKLDSNFIKASDLGQQVLFTGQVGEIDGVPVIKVPSTIMNGLTDNHVNFMIVHRDAVACPIKLTDYQVYETVPHWSGSLVEGRIVHDLFVLDAKAEGIYVHVHA